MMRWNQADNIEVNNIIIKIRNKNHYQENELGLVSGKKINIK